VNGKSVPTEHEQIGHRSGRDSCSAGIHRRAPADCSSR